eukprot:CAMPEP_0205802310 /NCGR_PEP_ID=MMETSP0205-20121125/4584_1 /ASSEMBLY_ACC=CAM_ASM_000278 /TAXON_ID=36767 /ORGANISM="Euplotes focardii, Strain TN1" /LENGTH=171 /DNA_ID=CAMNT_0053068501 /DNA_START=798 /DNA_END=1310 /DNA_ORIENTATION=-
MDKWYKAHGIEGAEKIKTVNSINMRGLPKTIEEVDMFNDSIGFHFELPIMSNFAAAIKKSSENFHKGLNLFSIVCIRKFSNIIPYVPEFIMRIFVQGFYDGLDMQFSNVPFSSEPWHVCNKEAKKIGVFSHNHHHTNLFFVATTYKGELFLTATANEALKMDPQLLVDYMT